MVTGEELYALLDDPPVTFHQAVGAGTKPEATRATGRTVRVAIEGIMPARASRSAKRM
jgi:hypothetical protein